MIDIIDINNRHRNINTIKRIRHQIRDAISGELIGEDYVEVTVVGRFRNWKQFYPLKEFKRVNPNIKV